MSRSGYSDDSDLPLQLYRAAVDRATFGKRGQALLKRLAAALDAMPVKRLIAGNLTNKAGEVCALGALDPKAPALHEDDAWGIEDDDDHATKLAEHFNIAPALAAEIVYMNDEYNDWRTPEETPEERWTRMRAWVEKQIGPDLEAEGRVSSEGSK